MPEVKRTLPRARRAASKKRMIPRMRKREPKETRPTPISACGEDEEAEE